MPRAQKNELKGSKENQGGLVNIIKNLHLQNNQKYYDYGKLPAKVFLGNLLLVNFISIR